jgi:hypothetical protein
MTEIGTVGVFTIVSGWLAITVFANNQSRNFRLFHDMVVSDGTLSLSKRISSHSMTATSSGIAELPLLEPFLVFLERYFARDYHST